MLTQLPKPGKATQLDMAKSFVILRELRAEIVLYDVDE